LGGESFFLRFVPVQFGEQTLQIVAGELPLEGRCGEFAGRLEVQQPALRSGQIVGLIGCERLTLNHGKVDFHLAEPTGVDRGWDFDGMAIPGGQTASMKRSPPSAWRVGNAKVGGWLAMVNGSPTFISTWSLP